MTTLLNSIAIGEICNVADVEKKLAIDYSAVVSGNTSTLALPAGSRTFTFPDVSTTLVGLDNAQTLTNKTINASVNILTNIDATNITSGNAPASNGGTGITSYAVGDILYASGVTTLSKLADIATGNALITGGVGAAPSYGKIGLTTHVSGTLPVVNGGTSFSAYTIGDIIYASAAGVLSLLADIATGNALISGGVGAVPSYGKIGLTTHVSGTLPVANGGTSFSAYTIGDIIYASGATTLSKLADIATGNAIISGGVGAAPSYGKIGLTTHVSGVLPVVNGGTNSSAALNNNRALVSSGGSLVEAAAMTNGQLLIGSTGAAPVVASLTAGSGITITPAAGSITITSTGGGTESMMITSLQTTVSSTTESSLAYFIPWQNTKYSTYTTRTIAFHMTYVNKSLGIYIKDSTLATTYGSLTGIASTGIKTFTFSNPGVDGYLVIRVIKESSGGTAPIITGIVMELS